MSERVHNAIWQKSSCVRLFVYLVCVRFGESKDFSPDACWMSAFTSYYRTGLEQNFELLSSVELLIWTRFIICELYTVIELIWINIELNNDDLHHWFCFETICILEFKFFQTCFMISIEHFCVFPPEKNDAANEVSSEKSNPIQTDCEYSYFSSFISSFIEYFN